MPDTPAIHPQLIAHIKRYVNITVEDELVICSSMELKTFRKKELLLEPGKHCQGNYFVLTGLLRQYYVNPKLNEQIIQFALEGWWMADQESLLFKTAAATYIQALEPTEVLLLPERHREQLFKQVPALESYFRQIMQRSFVAAQRRIGFIFNQSDEERYLYFSSLFPAFMQRVPQYMLASYLGFTPQFLSRLRKKEFKNVKPPPTQNI